MNKVFISYKSDDIQHKDALKSINYNKNIDICFFDSSLAEDVRNKEGHINRRPPWAERSQKTLDIIKNLLRQSNKLLVLIGPNTHSSEWVREEIRIFLETHDFDHILFMRVKGDTTSGFRGIDASSIKNWSMPILSRFLA
jgi:hypothetical protein